MAEKVTGKSEVDPFEIDIEEEEEDEDGSASEKVARTRRPLLLASKSAMEQLLILRARPRQHGDAELAQALLETIVYGRLPAQASSVVKTAVMYDITVAFQIAVQDWSRR